MFTGSKHQLLQPPSLHRHIRVLIFYAVRLTGRERELMFPFIRLRSCNHKIISCSGSEENQNSHAIFNNDISFCETKRTTENDRFVHNSCNAFLFQFLCYANNSIAEIKKK